MPRGTRKLTPEGSIKRERDCVVVQVPGQKHMLDIPGVTLLNRDAPESEWICEKRFYKNRVYLPHEYDKAKSIELRGENVVVLAMNGFSSITPAKCRQWGVKPGAYESACEGILLAIYQSLQNEFQGIKVFFAHGASDMGVDKAVLKVVKKVNGSHLGHSCPKFMVYVEDCGVPVHVARTQLEYADCFTSTADILIAANGRKQAFDMDIDAMFKKHKDLIPVNVLKAISSNGGPPAVDQDGNIEDAVAFLYAKLHLQYSHHVQATNPYRNTREFLCERITSIVRSMVDPECSFSSQVNCAH